VGVAQAFDQLAAIGGVVLHHVQSIAQLIDGNTVARLHIQQELDHLAPRIRLIFKRGVQRIEQNHGETRGTPLRAANRLEKRCGMI